MWQTCVRALHRLGLSKELLKHGIKREAYLFPLASNLKDYLEGHASDPAYYHQSFETLVTWWRERWLLPRAERLDGWRSWNRSEIEGMVMVAKGQE